MRDQLISYVDLLFAGAEHSGDMKDEILQNTLDRYDDLIASGKVPEAAYRLAISGIGDINEVLGTPTMAESVAAPENVKTDYRGRPLPSARKRILRAVAIGLYICCVVPVIALSNIGDGILGVCLMFLLVAAATVLIIMSSNGDEESEQEEKPDKYEQKYPIYKAYKSVSGALTLGIYLVVSFATGAWYITWLIFPISGCMEGLILAIWDLKEGDSHEN